MKGNGSVSSLIIRATSYGPFTFQFSSNPIDIAFVGQLKEQRTQSAQFRPMRIVPWSTVIFASEQSRTHFMQRMHLSSLTFICGPCSSAYIHSTRKIALHTLSQGCNLVRSFFPAKISVLFT